MVVCKGTTEQAPGPIFEATLIRSRDQALAKEDNRQGLALAFLLEAAEGPRRTVGIDYWRRLVLASNNKYTTAKCAYPCLRVRHTILFFPEAVSRQTDRQDPKT